MHAANFLQTICTYQQMENLPKCNKFPECRFQSGCVVQHTYTLVLFAIGNRRRRRSFGLVFAVFGRPKKPPSCDQAIPHGGLSRLRKTERVSGQPKKEHDQRKRLHAGAFLLISSPPPLPLLPPPRSVTVNDERLNY